MNESPVNFHRSFAALLVGNLIALFVSGVICILIGHATHADFFEKLRAFKLEKKQQQQDSQPDQNNENETKPDAANKGTNQAQANSKQNTDNRDKAKPDSQPDEAKAKPPERPKPEPLEPKRPEFPFGFLVITLFTNVVCALAAGFVCVWIAGFARHQHGMLMALFIVVWKVQQLLGFVENQVPATLLTIELIALPVACIVGASIATEHGTELNEPENDLDHPVESDSAVHD